jgi:hypothetical protein
VFVDESYQFLGRLIALLLGASLASYFVIRGINASSRSMRLANLALACGLFTFVLPERVFDLGDSKGVVLLVSGVVHSVIGCAGVLLATTAIWARRDGGAGVARIVTAILLGLGHVGMAGALLLYGGVARESERIAEGEPGSDAWVYESPDGAFRLSLPSRDWQQVGSKKKGMVAAFRKTPPLLLQAIVLRADRGQSKSGYDAAVTSQRQRAASEKEHKFRDGTNTVGNSYSYLTLMDSGPSGEKVFVGHCIVWCPSRQMIVEVIVEGMHKMTSETGRAVEKEAFDKAAEFICLSVE